MERFRRRPGTDSMLGGLEGVGLLGLDGDCDLSERLNRDGRVEFTLIAKNLPEYRKVGVRLDRQSQPA